MTTLADQGSSRKKKACVECRQQKMRCEGGSSDGPTSCSRCARLNISCVFSLPFERVHKRKRMQELERETVALKRELQSVAPITPALPQYATSRRAVQSRTIDGLEVSSSIVDDCFERYYRDFHIQLPILDPLISVDDLYRYSPLLFWVVLSIGSRKYDKHPTLIYALSPRVTNHVMMSTNPKSIPIEFVKALILFLTWPFPSNSFDRTSSFVFGAMLIHMAMQCGLHTPYLDTESSRLGLNSLDIGSLERAKLWAYVVITYQRLCTISGQPALMSLDAYNEHAKFKDILLQFPATLQLQFHLANTLARAHKTFVDLNLLTMTLQQESALDSVLKKLNSRIDSIESKAVSTSDAFFIAIARQEINAMHFFKSPNTLDDQSCHSIFDATTRLFELILSQETPHALSSACPCYVILAALMGASLILRILRGSFSTNIDQEHGSTLYLAIIEFLKSCSIGKGDGPDRGAALAERLWKSDKLFKDNNGSIDIALRVRNKLASSPMGDVVLRWEDELSDRAIITEPIRHADYLERQNSPAMFLGHSTSGTNVNALTGNIFDEANTIPTNEIWGDLDLDLNNDWDFFSSITE